MHRDKLILPQFYDTDALNVEFLGTVTQEKGVIPELVNYHQKIVDLAYKVIAHCNVKEKAIITLDGKPKMS